MEKRKRGGKRRRKKEEAKWGERKIGGNQVGTLINTEIKSQLQ